MSDIELSFAQWAMVKVLKGPENPGERKRGGKLYMC